MRATLFLARQGSVMSSWCKSEIARRHNFKHWRKQTESKSKHLKGSMKGKTRVRHTMMRIGIARNYVSPFSNEIEHGEPPAKFSSPKFLDYIGTKDPITQVQHFKTTMAPMSFTQGKRNAMTCKLFATTLLDGTQKWFNNLSPHTITSFSQFSRLFITNYAYDRPLRKESHHFFSITQGRGESIKEYMRRFR